MSDKHPLTSEQRQRPRLLCNSQFSYLRVRTSDSEDAIDVSPVNFNCYGIAFFSPQPIAENAALKFSLCYDSETMLVELEGLLGEVIYVKGSDVGFYVGVAFVTAQVEEPSALEALALIETDLQHYQSDEDRYHLANDS